MTMREESKAGGSMQKKKVLGITGGIGAGKSTVLAYLKEKYGVCVIQADEVGRLLQTPGHDCFDRIVDSFGVGILDADGLLDRGALAARVFADRALLAKLNAIVHPAVKAHIMREIARERADGCAPFVAVEAALLLEDGYDRICDEIWYVYADERTRAARLTASRGYDRERVERVMRSQMGEAEYRARCQFVIDNSSDFVENTYEQIDRGLMGHGFLQHCEWKQR